MQNKVKINELFLEWFKQTNPHLFKKGVSTKEITKELEEYINDALLEHIEFMEDEFEEEQNKDKKDKDSDKEEENDGDDEEV